MPTEPHAARPCGDDVPQEATVSTSTANPILGAATLTYDGSSVQLPVVKGSENETAVVIETLRNKTGMITLDPGFGNTGS